jgi:hypothetical protein
VSHLGLAGAGRLDLYVNATALPAPHRIDASGPVTVTAFDPTGRQVGAPHPAGPHGVVLVPAGGFATVSPR